MKKLLLLSILCFSILVSSSAQDVMVGVINAQEIIEKTQRGKEIQRELENAQKEMQAEVKALENQVKDMQKALESPNMGQSEREEMEAEYQELKLQYTRKIEDAQKQMNVMSMTRLQDLQKEIMPLINQVGKEMGFTLIFDVSSSGSAYFDERIDITDIIVRTVDERFR